MKKQKKLSASRRDFIGTGIKLSAMIPFMGPSFLSPQQSFSLAGSPARPVHPLKILILGGTSFLGPQQIAYALGRGHSISIFTRGRTKPTTQKDVFDEVEFLTGDRENNLEALKGRKWDVVIDNSGGKVKWTKDSAQLLKDNVDIYLYTSSTGVYYPYLGSNIKESTLPVLKVPAGINEVQKMEYDYGVMKANSELEVINAFGKDRSIIVRPTYMIGPGDKTDRFSYWPVRLNMGGEVLVPGKINDPVQYIDVRDVAEWMIRLIENKKAGTFNAVGPASKTGMLQFVHGAHAAFNSAATFIPVSDYALLKKHNVFDAVPWIMPVEDNAGSALVNIDHALANGLTFTPLAKTVKDIHDWWNTADISEERKNRMISGKDSLMNKEKMILSEWKLKK